MTVTPVLKYEQPRTTHLSGVTIWEIPGSGLYRTLEINQGQFRIETLTQNGWTQLLTLRKGEVKTAQDALSLWLGIQTPADMPDDDGSTA